MKRKAVRGDFQVLKSVQLRKTVEQSLDSTFVETEKIAFDGNRWKGFLFGFAHLYYM